MDSRVNGSCLTCVHFERMYRACKYDFPKGLGLRALREKERSATVRIKPQTDIRSFRCNDYLSWETGVLPFSTPAQAELPGLTADGADR